MQNNPRKREHSSPPSTGSIRQTKIETSPSDGDRSPAGQPESQQLPTFDYNKSPRGRKRRRNAYERASNPDQSPEPSRKSTTEDVERSPQEELNCCAPGAGKEESIRWWARFGKWPNNFGDMSGSRSHGSTKRRRASTPTYSSRRRQGSAPIAHSAAYEDVLQRHGIMFDDMDTRGLLSTESKELCQSLLSMEFEPAYNACSEETYARLCQRASKCNEERVRRDLTPHIVPSAELLYILDQETGLENVREELSGAWTKCSPFGGTQPRPDHAYGLSSATFTEQEHAKLEIHTNVDRPTKFTECMYFPFLLCEAKCGRKNINDADRQNAHSASIAVNAIIQLCRSAGEDIAQSLSGHILVFSISHDNERVKIYGHFPLLRNGRTTFHRYLVHAYLTDPYGLDRNKGSNFTRAVYRSFYPSHLERLQQAIALLPDPQTTSMASDVSLDEGEEERDSSSRSSFFRAKSQGSQRELLLMRQMYKTQMQQLGEENQRQREENQKQREENQKQREESQMQMQQLREENQKQMRQQREENEKQMRQQREENQKQMALLLELFHREQRS